MGSAHEIGAKCICLQEQRKIPHEAFVQCNVPAAVRSVPEAGDSAETSRRPITRRRGVKSPVLKEGMFFYRKEKLMTDLINKSDAEIAALAVRTHSTDLLAMGLNGLFDSTAVNDYRDIISALVLYYDAAKRLNLNADEFFLEYAKGNKRSQESLATSVSRSPQDKVIGIGGYKVVEHPEFHYVFSFGTDT